MGGKGNHYSLVAVVRRLVSSGHKFSSQKLLGERVSATLVLEAANTGDSGFSNRCSLHFSNSVQILFLQQGTFSLEFLQQLLFSLPNPGQCEYGLNVLFVSFFAFKCMFLWSIEKILVVCMKIAYNQGGDFSPIILPHLIVALYTKLHVKEKQMEVFLFIYFLPL